MTTISNQYIFTEEEFESDDFNASSFVTKYRRVTPLESLKEQLRNYADSLKEQLYSIINRDYKDFISIATKLDGVDFRVEHLRKPLVDLRLDLSTLHDGMLASMETIQDKLKRKTEVSNKRFILESTLECFEKLQLAEEIVENSTQNITDLPSREKKLSRRDLLRNFNKGEGLNDETMALQKEAFECSELERAAYLLNASKDILASVSMQQRMKASAGATGTSEGGDTYTSKTIATSMPLTLTSMKTRVDYLIDVLLQRVHLHLNTILTSFHSSVSANTLGSSTLTPSPLGSSTLGSSTLDPSPDAYCTGPCFPRLAFLHCIRALLVLDRGDIAETAVADSIVRPIIRSYLTQGRLDGSAGRGSFGGLLDTLIAFSEQMKTSLQIPIDLVEQSLAHAPNPNPAYCNPSNPNPNSSNAYSTSPNPNPSTVRGLDLVIHGIWIPVSSLLIERFPTMFNVAIPSTFSRCFRACEAFKHALAHVSGPQHAPLLTRRLAQHPSVLGFQQRWRFDVYYQLRVQEVCARLDKACDVTFTSGLTANVYDLLLAGPSVLTVPPTVLPTVTPTAAALTLSSLTPSDMKQLSTDVSITPYAYSSTSTSTASTCNVQYAYCYRIPLLAVFATEMCTCLHPSVMLSPLSGRFLELSLRLISRLEIHLSLAVDIPCSSVPRPALLAALAPGPVPGLVPEDSTSALTPVKKPVAATAVAVSPTVVTAATPATPIHSSTSSTVGTHVHVHNFNMVQSVEDMILLTAELFNMEQWLVTTFTSYTCQRLGLNLDIDMQATVTGWIASQVKLRLGGTRAAVWLKGRQLLGVDCKKHLSGVRVIAGKYRMTNKPPPDGPSSYVDTIFQPLRSFLERYGSLISAFASSSSSRWDVELVEDVTCHFISQVQSLMETVKQMDSALQRRSKLRTGTAGSTSTSVPSNSNLTDSEKISLQVYLDVKEFAEEIKKIGVDPADVKSYAVLLNEVAATNAAARLASNN